MARSEVILTICAHNDDQIIGAGGTLAKYAREGKTVRTIICSFGASSHPHLQRKVIVRQRVGESIRADKIMGGKGIAYLGLEEGHFDREFGQKCIADKLAAIIQREAPAKIFTHASDDLHADHRAVNRLVQSLLDRGAILCPTFEFPVWHLAKLTRRGAPQLIVDISKTFATKLKAFEAHESQQVTIWNLFWNVYLRARLLGLLYRCRYAELFYLMEPKSDVKTASNSRVKK